MSVQESSSFFHGGGWARPFKAGLMGLGLAELYTLIVVAPLVHSRHTAVYHWSGSPMRLFAAAFLDVLIVWVVMGALLWRAEVTGQWRTVVWTGIVLFTPAIMSKNWHVVCGMADTMTLRLFAAAVVGCGALLWLWRPGWNEGRERGIGLASSVLLCFGAGGVLLMGQMGWYGWKARGLNRPPVLHRHIEAARRTNVAMSGSQAGGHGSRTGRVIWIIFDELSYRQVYERRYPGLELPAFDALAAESTVFTQTVPAGLFTDQVVPTLLTGEAVDVVRSSPGGGLLLHRQDEGRWKPFEARETIFGDALKAGYRTAAVGWYVPYCRIMASVLDRCEWAYEARIKNGMFATGSVGANMLQPLELMVSSERATAATEFEAGSAKLHIEEYKRLVEGAEWVLNDQSAGFVLLHVPIPHLGGIYNRATGRLTTGPSTYLDNVALADRYLEGVRSLLERTGQWDSSTVVVMGDHSWRTRQIWKASAEWTTEEEKASEGGRFDPRPVYVVKLPGQRTGARVETAYPAVRTRALLDGIVQGRMRTPEDLMAWVGEQE